MRVVVVGAGAWGLPTAAELVRRGHQVIVVDRHGPGNPLSSSSGPTRLWRVADPDPAAIRLGRRTQQAMRRLEERLGRAVHTSTGLLWRDAAGPLDQITRAVRSEGVAHTEVPAAQVADFFPGLRPDQRDALWFPEAGSLLSAEALAGYGQLFDRGGGRAIFGTQVTSVTSSPAGAVVALADGQTLEAEVAVVCAGPGTPELLGHLGLEIPLRAYLEQVVHLGRVAEPHRDDALACLFDGPGDHGPGLYSMPTPGVGYKVGMDQPLRELLSTDFDRSPDQRRTRAIVERTDAILPSPGREVIDEFVCCWTDSPDGWFVIDRVGSVIVAGGDSGKGFKYSPALGEILADLAEGDPPDPDIAAMSSRRFQGLDLAENWAPTSLGGAQT